MNKTERHAYGTELTAAVISEIAIWEFTADEKIEEIFHKRNSEKQLVESFKYVMDWLTEEEWDIDYIKSEFHETIQALNHLLQIIPESVIKEYDMEILL